MVTNNNINNTSNNDNNNDNYSNRNDNLSGLAQEAHCSSIDLSSIFKIFRRTPYVRNSLFDIFSRYNFFNQLLLFFF